MADECKRCGSVGGYGCYECTPDVEIYTQADLDAAVAAAMFGHAINPSSATYLAGRFGGSTEPVTKEDVAARFGAEAAQAWQDARDAKARFFAAIRAQGET